MGSFTAGGASRRSALLALALALACCTTAAAGNTATAKPNIVYFLVDDLGFANVGYNNRPNPEPLTPHIDSLHDSGAELTVRAAASPTRAGFSLLVLTAC
jgi:hypothetical protein